MATSEQLEATRADDDFERHYAEKIWSLIPGVYRDEDRPALSGPGPLRAFVEILAGQAAIARRSNDRLWADTRADEADDWAIPYLGELVGARPVNALNRAGQRVNLARTILYRRRLGTVRLAELLADDIADWDAVAAEAFKRLLRHWHGLDGGPRTTTTAGVGTATPQWGFADLRNVRIGALLDGPHDDVSHLPDVRRQRGLAGRYGIAKLNLHLFRQYAFLLTGVTPRRIDSALYTLDPSGRDRALFQPGRRDQADCVATNEWEVRAPINCRQLHAAGFAPSIEHAPVGLANLLAPLYGRRFATEAALLAAANAALAADPAPPNTLSDAQSAALIAAAMEADTPRFQLIGDAIALTVADSPAAASLQPHALYAANLAEWAVDHGVPGWVDALVDPELGRVRLQNALPPDRDLHSQRIFYGIFWPLGAGTHDRASGLAASGFTPVVGAAPNFTGPLSGELRFVDSRTVRPVIPAGGIITVDGDLTLSAANGERPFVEFDSASGDVTLQSTVDGLELVIDGLWLGITGAATTRLIIDGNWRRVVLRHATLDPGGERAAPPGGVPAAIPAITLAFSGAVDEVLIDHAMIGPVEEAASTLDACAVNEIQICHSIVDARTAGTRALFQPHGRTSLTKTTVLGDVVCARLDASEVLIDGSVEVEDAQTGCFRFSAAATGGRVPHPYESHFFFGGMPAGTFASTRFADPGYAQLAQVAPAVVRTGGENGTEIGAFNEALDPIKRADLRAKLDEFMPINAIAQLIFET